MIRLLLILILFIPGCAAPRPWTDGEKTILVWSVLAVGADIFTTCRALDNPYNYEINPYMSAHPSDGRVIITFSLTHLALITVAHFNPTLRYTLLGSKAALNTGFAIHNTTLDWSSNEY